MSPLNFIFPLRPQAGPDLHRLPSHFFSLHRALVHMTRSAKPTGKIGRASNLEKSNTAKTAAIDLDFCLHLVSERLEPHSEKLMDDEFGS